MLLVSLMMLAVVCGNVGTLMLARTATRSNEIAVRNALGAGRTRIVMQLFVESLVLAVSAAAVGLFLSQLAASRLPLLKLFEAAMPFWFDLGVTPFTVAVAGALAVFSAVISGLVPALRVTGKRAYHTLQRQSAGASGLRFGAVATALIVVEVAIAVGGLSGVVSVAEGAFGDRSFGEGIAVEEYLTTRLSLAPIGSAADLPNRSVADSTRRLAAFQEALSRRLAAEPAVRAATFASVLPGMDHDRRRVEIEGAGVSPGWSRARVVNVAQIDRSFFDVLGQSVLVGRGFEPRDLKQVARPVIVNRSFVDKVLEGRRPLGERIRYATAPDKEPGPWHEIIGVVNESV